MAILEWLHCFFDWMKLPMSKEEQIGLLLGKWTDNEKSFVGLTSDQANSFLRFAYDWLHLTDSAALDDEWRRLDAMRETGVSFDADDK
jgi:hypothetical protein